MYNYQDGGSADSFAAFLVGELMRSLEIPPALQQMMLTFN
jgi:hypothetical protein